MCESVSELIDELTASDVHAVHDGVLLAAKDAVRLAARLQHLGLRVFLYHHPNLL